MKRFKDKRPEQAPVKTGRFSHAAGMYVPLPAGAFQSNRTGFTYPSPAERHAFSRQAATYVLRASVSSHWSMSVPAAISFFSTRSRESSRGVSRGISESEKG